MPTRAHYIEQIEKEFASAEAASAAGNEGKSRVCARRAAGIALAWFASRYPRPGWRADALSMLLALGEEGDFPEKVRQAAERLTTKVSGRFTYAFSERPVDDAKLIVQAVLERMA